MLTEAVAEGKHLSQQPPCKEHDQKVEKEPQLPAAFLERLTFMEGVVRV